MVRAAGEICAVHDRLYALAVSARQIGERLRDALRGLLQPFALRILAKLDKQRLYELRNLLLVRLFL